ncbi:MAG TPA: hypothetical protein VNX00_03335 [Herbaspirillum sp.]|jgi:hypothetical protein|nr:hypothetical protein [Herbaspirillum sp.]
MLRAQRLAFMLMLLLSSFLSAGAAVAADQTMPPPKAGARLAQLFVRPVTLRGTLNGAKIQMTLHLKPDEKASLEGSYFLFGQNNKILLVGEFEEDALMMEESINGKDVSGLWDGVYDGTVLSGNWSSLDGSVLRPFVLKVVPAGQ